MHPLVILIIIVLAWLGWRWLRRQPRAIQLRWLAIVGLGVVVALLATGRVHWILAVFGALLALGLRVLPLLSYLPLLRRWFGNHAEDGAAGGSAGDRRDERRRGEAMSSEEAYAILGLEPEASTEQVIEAHRRLIQRNHPDRGGSSYIAAQLNAAKERLVGVRRAADE